MDCSDFTTYLFPYERFGCLLLDDPPSPIPIELIFTAARIAPPHATRPTISPSGAHLVYWSERAADEAKPRGFILPSGAPTDTLSITPYILDLATGTSTALGPHGARSWRPWWSPDGTELAFYSDADGFPQLWVHDVATGRHRKVSERRIKVKSMVGDEPCWSADGTELFVSLHPGVADDPDDNLMEATNGDTSAPSTARRAVEIYRAGSEAEIDAGAERDADVTEDPDRRLLLLEACSIAAISVADGSVRTIVDRNTKPYPNVLQRSPSGRWLSYSSVSRAHVETGADGKTGTRRSTTFSLAVVRAAGGKVAVLAEELTMVVWLHLYRDSYIWHPSRDLLLWVLDGALWASGCGRAVGEPIRLGDHLGRFTAKPLSVTADGQAVIAGLGSVNQRDIGEARPNAIAVIPLPSKSTPKRDERQAQVIALPPGIEFRDLVEGTPNRAWSPRPEPSVTIFGQRSDTTDRVLMRADLSSGEVRILWEAAASVRFLGCAGDPTTIIGSYEDLNTPSDIYRFDANGERLERLTSLEPRLDGVRFGPMKPFTTRVPQPEGSLTDATSLLLLPEGAAEGDELPCLTIVYPGKGAKANGAFGGGFESTLPVAAFLSRGYAVLIADAPIGPRGPQGGHPLQDLVDVLVPQVYRAADLGYIDVERVAIAGQSYGGYGAVAAISATTLFRAAIAVNGRYDLLGTYEDCWSEGGQGRMGTHPWADQQRYLLNSPYARADRIRTPLLLVHGEHDDIRAPDGYKMFKALERLGQPVQLAVYKGCGHVPSEWGLANLIDATKRMVDFLDRHLGQRRATR